MDARFWLILGVVVLLAASLIIWALWPWARRHVGRMEGSSIGFEAEFPDWEEIILLTSVHGLNVSVFYQLDRKVAMSRFDAPVHLRVALARLSCDSGLVLLVDALDEQRAGRCFGLAYDRLQDDKMRKAWLETLDAKLLAAAKGALQGLVVCVRYHVERIPDHA